MGYDYPHDHPGGWVAQQYLPAEQADKLYYQPSRHGAESEVGALMEEHTMGQSKMPGEEL